MKLSRSSQGSNELEGRDGHSDGEVRAGESYAGPLEQERGAASVSPVRSLQSRVSSLLAAGLMMALGAGLLVWYYAHAYARMQAPGESAQATKRREAGDAPLPSLGTIEPPHWVEQAGAEPGTEPGEVTVPGPVLESSLPLLPEPAAPEVPSQPLSATPQKTSRQLALERRLSGAVFVRPSRDVPQAGLGIGTNGLPDETEPNVQSPQPEGHAASSGDMAMLLRSTETAAVKAKILPARRLLLPKGAFIDCTLETAIDSTLPGMTTCITATDTFGVDGSVVLLERGTKLVGETRGQVQQGAARVFVLWTEARTPTGVIVPLDSPGTDELGRSGLPGRVNRHFWDRFGSALLISMVDGAVQTAVHASGGGGAVIYNPSGSQDVLTEVLKSTVSIPPTVVKHNGDRIQVLVARDLDFRSVYELRAHEHAD